MQSKQTSTLKQGEKAGIVGIIINFILFLSKLCIGIMTGAVSITADSINNLSDTGSSVISLISFKIAQKPADREHPFGHARIEYVMSMIVAFIIFSTGFSLFRDSIEKIIFPQELVFKVVLVPVLVMSILAKLFLCIYYRRMGKKLNSAVLHASSTDSLVDVISTSVILAVMIIYRCTELNLDAYLGICVSVLVLISAVKIIIESKNSILGTAPDSTLVRNITELVGGTADILEVHDIIVHNYGGGKTLASLHVAVDGNKSAFEIHDIVDAIEHRLENELGVECTIHTDPIDPQDKKLKEVTANIAALLREIDPRLTIHDCRIFTDSDKPLLAFDILQPFELTADISETVQQMLHTVYPEYNLHITIDKG